LTGFCPFVLSLSLPFWDSWRKAPCGFKGIVLFVRNPIKSKKYLLTYSIYYSTKKHKSIYIGTKRTKGTILQKLENTGVLALWIMIQRKNLLVTEGTKVILPAARKYYANGEHRSVDPIPEVNHEE
jgi:hypothetical protein